MAEDVGGKPPLVKHWKQQTLFNLLVMQGKNLPVPHNGRQMSEFLKDLELPTDDWPFLYLRKPTIPWHYVTVILGMLLIAFIACGAPLRFRLNKIDAPLFLLGAGFLLLETRSVTQFSLLFGSTWSVNLLVFSSVLLMLVVANAFVLRAQHRGKQLRIRGYFVLLVFSLIALSFVPVSWISGQPMALQWILAGSIVGIPICLAGIIFPALFARCADSRTAFASNLLGAIVGGVAEYSTMLLGIRSLGLLAAVFYLLAMLIFLRGARRKGVPSAL